MKTQTLTAFLILLMVVTFVALLTANDASAPEEQASPAEPVESVEPAEPPTVESIGGTLPAIRDRLVLAISLRYAASSLTPTPSDVDFRPVSVAFWRDAATYFLASEQGQSLAVSSPAVAVVVQTMLNELPARMRRPEQVRFEADRLILLLAAGDWADLGYPTELLGGPPSSELRAALLSLVSVYSQQCINETLTALGEYVGEPVTPSSLPGAED